VLKEAVAEAVFDVEYGLQIYSEAAVGIIDGVVEVGTLLVSILLGEREG
jgi:hypothetical protein